MFFAFKLSININKYISVCLLLHWRKKTCYYIGKKKKIKPGLKRSIVMQHIERGDLAEATCVSFHHHDNGHCQQCSFICFDYTIRLMPTFSRQNPSRLEDLFQEIIKQQRTWLTLTIIMVMKWETCSFHNAPLASARFPLSMCCITIMDSQKTFLWPSGSAKCVCIW